jgi:hypothetical protein
MRTCSVAAFAVVIQVLVACGGDSGSSTSTPTNPTPPTPQLAMFMDPDSTFSTTDVRDVDDQTVQFDTASNSLIWVADGRSFPGYPVSGNFIAGTFQVRFGTKNGEHRAYFTEASSATICDIAVNNGQLSITATPETVPHN